MEVTVMEYADGGQSDDTWREWYEPLTLPRERILY